MGQVDDQALGKKGSKRGSTNNGRRLAGLTQREPVQAGTSLWARAHPDSLAAVVTWATALGGAAMFGLSRDAGASSLTLYLDGEREVLWFNGDADLDLECEKVATYLASLGTR
jgi:hypothetical protein